MARTLRTCGPRWRRDAGRSPGRARPSSAMIQMTGGPRGSASEGGRGLAGPLQGPIRLGVFFICFLFSFSILVKVLYLLF